MNPLSRKVLLIALLSTLLFAFSACGSDSGGDRQSGDDDDDDSVDDDVLNDDASDDDAADDDAADDDIDDDGEIDYTERAAGGQVRAMVHDVSGPLVYAADAKNNQVLVIDTSTFDVVDTIPVGSDPVDLDLSPDGTRLWVATAGASAVTWVDLGSKASGTVTLNHSPASIAVGGNGKVYVPDEDRKIEIVDEATQALITEADWGVDPYLIGTFIEIDRTAGVGFVADAGSSPSNLVRFDLSTDDLDVLEINEFGSLGSNGQSLSLAPDGATIVYPCGSGNGDGYTVEMLNATDFSIMLGTFDIGTYPLFMEYDPAGDFIAGINGDPYDQRLYVMDPATFNPLSVIDVAEWLNPPDADPPRNQDLMSLRANADGSVLVLYAEDTYNDLEGYFYFIRRADLM